jgi:hypothetical protein
MYETLIIEGKADTERKECYDCKYLKGAMTWWCTNDDAVKVRGTAYTKVCNCPYWEATTHIDDLGFFQKLFKSGYIEIKR